jgi:hypothetical protein
VHAHELGPGFSDDLAEQAHGLTLGHVGRRVAAVSR